MSAKKLKKIVFVCTGNTCRSPMAEYLLKRELKKAKLRGFKVCSAGVGAKKGEPMNLKTVQVLTEHGGIMDKADLIKMISQKFNICRATSYNLIKKLDTSQFSLSKDGKALFSLSKDLSNEQTELSFD